jgi:hypothetical protein
MDKIKADQDLALSFSVRKTYELTVSAADLAEALGVDLDKLTEHVRTYNDEWEEDGDGEELDPTDEQLSALISLTESFGDVSTEDFDLDGFTEA